MTTDQVLDPAGSITVNLGNGTDTATSLAAAGTATAAITWNGGAGADSITVVTGATAGVDTFGTGGATGNFGAAGQSVASTANTFAATIAATNTITFANGVDCIAGFAQAADLLDIVTAAEAAAPTTLIGLGSTAALANGTAYVLYGTWNAANNTFTAAGAYAAGTAQDAIEVVGNGTLTTITTTGMVVLDDLAAALGAANFA